MKKRLLIPAILCLLVCLCFIGIHFHDFFIPTNESVSEYKPERPIASSSALPEKIAESSSESEAVPDEPYISPIDFEMLQNANPDIYGWLYIPGTQIDYPILQSEDDAFYLDHDCDKNWSSDGCIFSESAYNDGKMGDKITALYGHRMLSGAMFGTLQMVYSEKDALKNYGEIIVYLPEKELHFKVFAAVPYDNRHILYNYGDETVLSLNSFLQSVYSVKSLDAQISVEDFASVEDQLLVLSTCLKGDRTRRFIVVGKLI